MKLWIARDLDGTLSLYETRPILVGKSYFDIPSSSYNMMYLDGTKFPEVTFENSPQKVKLELC